MASGDGGTTMGMCLMPPNCTPKNGENDHFYLTYIFSPWKNSKKVKWIKYKAIDKVTILSQSSVLGEKQRSYKEMVIGDQAKILWLNAKHSLSRCISPSLTVLVKTSFHSYQSCKARWALGELHWSLCDFTCLQQNHQLSSVCGIPVADGGVKRKRGTAWFPDPSWRPGAVSQRHRLWTRTWRGRWDGHHWDGVNMETHSDMFIRLLFRIEPPFSSVPLHAIAPRHVCVRERWRPGTS